jgi:hypothetical protein
MKKFLSLLFLVPFIAQAQVSDDFADSDFNNNPTWVGDSSEFQISTYSSSTWSLRPRLQLDGSIADISHLSVATPLPSLDNVEWDFWARFSLNTSSTNNARVYLVSDNVNLESSLNGYFVMFGDDTDDQLDSISLWKQTGLVTQKLIHGHIAFTGASRNYTVKVTRDNLGLWSLLVDTLGQNNPQLEGTVTDLSFTSSSYFGVYCKYTLSNKTNFYFDDIYVGPQIVDTIPPSLLSLNVISQNQLDVSFTENLQTASAENTTNYNVAGIGNPSSAIKDPVDASLVHLTFSTSFVSGTVYTLTVDNVMDNSLNPMALESRQFSWYIAQTYDIVINEIMADPDPPVGLPNYEYIELFNRTAIPISLKNWVLEIGTGSQTFPDITIAADSFLILTSDEAVVGFAPFGPCVGFGSFSLTNTGTCIQLKNATGVVIHSVSYTDSWYNDPTKNDGGWSIEQIDPENPCGGEFNWKASVSFVGGTPGSVNSVLASNPDNQPPDMINVSPISNTVLNVTFSEKVQPGVLSDPANFNVNNGIGTPSLATPGSDEKSVLLQFDSILSNNIVYTLYFTDTLMDCVGNMLIGDNIDFSLFQPGQFGIEINEIMADPDPPVGLPNYEYIELFNKTSYPVSLRGWSLLLGSSLKYLPDMSIGAGNYLILCPSGTTTLFSPYGRTAEVSGLTVTNTGTSISLLDTLHNVISTVTFTDDWYQNSVKADGGWSLEQIDPLNPCGESSNWKASVDASGGTPGKLNSVNSSNPDHIAPALIRASVSRIETNKVRLFFSEATDSTSLKNINKYHIDNSMGTPIAVKLVPTDYKSVILTLASQLQIGIIYTATITDSVFDCVGNMMAVQSSVCFAVPEVADSGDLVINEVLSNPTTECVDYVEIYNRSTRVFDLRELNLAEYDTLSATITSIYPISTDGFLIFPGEYAALTTDPVKVKTQYYTPNPNGFSLMKSFPSLNNDDGVVTICDGAMDIIDFMIYTADMQYPLLNSTDGVSLERINYNRPSLDKTNWHSAAENVGFGTPAYLNSQYSEAITDDGAITLSPDIFSPDEDGYNDVLNIAYTFGEPGYLANINIYDGNGRLVRELIHNELLGTSGVFSWDGITDGNEKANIGIYIIYIEVFDLKGDVKKYKKATVLAGHLK